MWAPAAAVAPVFDDQGQAFFPTFVDPVGKPESPTVQAMEVVEFDSDTADARVFQVQFKNGAWRIPSHFDYPADARERVGKTAAGVVGLRKDRIVSDRPADHVSLGVIDPMADSSVSLEGRGRRITLRDGGGAVLADFIVGLPVEGSPEMRYVRIPDQKRVYATKLDLDLSARFADWIETDLLKLDKWNLGEIVLDNYSVDEEQGTLTPGDVLTLRKGEGGSAWALEGLAEGEVIDDAKLTTLQDTLDELRIVGVRRKPAGLTKNLRAEESLRVDNRTLMELTQRGYFLTQDGGLVSNEGEVRAKTTDGILYTLRFGEVLFGDEDGGGPPPAPGVEAPKAGAENRYLFVTASFEDSVLKRPEPPVAPPVVEGEAAPPPPSDEVYLRELEEFDRKVEEGKKKARALTDRFADWYYVISGDSFRKLRLSRKDLLKGADGAAVEAPGEHDGHEHEEGAPHEDDMDDGDE
jgi:hypothetical protein